MFYVINKKKKLQNGEKKKQYFLDRMACQLLVIKYLLSHNTISQKLIKTLTFCTNRILILIINTNNKKNNNFGKKKF